MTNPTNPQNKPTSNQPQENRVDTASGNRPDVTRSQGSGDAQRSQQFGSIRGGVEQGYAAGARISPEIERCLDTIEENCRKLRTALEASGSGDMSRSQSSSASNPSSGNVGGRSATTR